MRRLTHPAVLSVAGLGLLAAAAWAITPPSDSPHSASPAYSSNGDSTTNRRYTLRRRPLALHHLKIKDR